MNSGFRMEMILEYSKVFNDKPELDELLSGIGRSTLLQISAFFLGFDNKQSEYHNPQAFISMFFQAKNNELANRIYDKIKAYQASTKAVITIPYTLTSLTLFEYAFQHLDENESLTQAEIEVNVFKAYLLINELHANKAYKGDESVKKIKSGEETYLSEWVFTNSYADSDLMNYHPRQLLITQIVKSIMLFEMLSSDRKANALLEAFLKYFECDDWRDYIKRLLPVVFACFFKRNEAHVDIVLEKNGEYQSSKDFLDKLIITEESALIEHDFTSVRANPIYQVKDDTYRIVFPLFAIEMLHKGLYFKLYDRNKTLSKTEGAFSDLRSYYCENFSENYLLYETIQRMYGKRYIKFTGQEMKNAGLEAEPDYYIRNGNKIFLFESKDVLIRADIKASFDYEQLEKALKEKFYYVDKGEGKVKKKAILQIINSIKNTLNKTLIVDDRYNVKRVIIYPILIVHHHQFDVSGLNNILKNWFQEELANLSAEIYDVSRIRPLTVINIDDLIYYQDLFFDKQITLEDLIEAYHKHTTFNRKKNYTSQDQIDEEVKATLVPFSTFVSSYVGMKKFRVLPKILKEKGFSIFKS